MGALKQAVQEVILNLQIHIKFGFDFELKDLGVTFKRKIKALSTDW